MKAKRKGPRYELSDDPRCPPTMLDLRGRARVVSEQDAVRLLNAGERAKAEVKRLRAERKALRGLCKEAYEELDYGGPQDQNEEEADLLHRLSAVVEGA